MDFKFIKHFKWKHILGFLALFFIMMVFMRYNAAQVKNISGGTGILDLNFGNSIEDIHSTMISLGEKGRQYYLKIFLVVDFFYAISYAMFYSFTLLFFINKINNKKKLWFISLSPIFGMVFDWLENLFLAISLANWTHESIMLYIILNIFTILKFIFVYLSLTLVIILFIYYLYKKITAKNIM